MYYTAIHAAGALVVHRMYYPISVKLRTEVTALPTEESRLKAALLDELEGVTHKEHDLEAQKKQIVSELEAIRRRRDLIAALIEASGFSTDLALAGNPICRYETECCSDLSNRSAKSACDVAYEILLARGKNPMHYEELAVAVVEAGGMLGGESPAQTLVARLSRDQRFVRPEKRGWYAAKDHYPKSKSVGTRTKKRVSAGQSAKGATGRRRR